MPQITNQQIFTELKEVKSSITDLKKTQNDQGNKILEILLRNAKKDGIEEGESLIKNRRKNDKVIFWTTIASMATAIGCIVAVITLIVMIYPKGI